MEKEIDSKTHNESHSSILTRNTFSEVLKFTAGKLIQASDQLGFLFECLGEGLKRYKLIVNFLIITGILLMRPFPTSAQDPVDNPEFNNYEKSEKAEELFLQQSEPLVYILCYFPDKPNVLPIDDYEIIRDKIASRLLSISRGKYNLSTVPVIGWYEYPSPSSAYRNDYWNGVTDCMRSADLDFDFSQISGVVVFNPDTSVSKTAAEVPVSIEIDGVNFQNMKSALIPFPSSGNIGIDIHEIMHMGGAPHSLGSTGIVYQNRTGLMSGNSGVHLEGDFTRLFGWMEHVAFIQPDQTITSRIQRLAEPVNNVDPELAIVEIGSGLYYAIEHRVNAGADSFLPLPNREPSVVITMFNSNIGLRLISEGNSDIDYNKYTWQNGELFYDPIHDVTIKVLDANSEYATVEIMNNSIVTDLSVLFNSDNVHDVQVGESVYRTLIINNGPGTTGFREVLVRFNTYSLATIHSLLPTDCTYDSFSIVCNIDAMEAYETRIIPVEYSYEFPGILREGIFVNPVNDNGPDNNYHIGPDFTIFAHPTDILVQAPGIITPTTGFPTTLQISVQNIHMSANASDVRLNYTFSSGISSSISEPQRFGVIRAGEMAFAQVIITPTLATTGVIWINASIYSEQEEIDASNNSAMIFVNTQESEKVFLPVMFK